MKSRGKATHTLRAPRRAATASIAGYHYQFAYTALRWLKAKPGHVLFCEGNEDLDEQHTDGTMAEIQLKAWRGSIGPSSRTVRKTLEHFATAFCEHHASGLLCILVFCSTAQLSDGSGSLLGRWMAGKKVDLGGLATEIQNIVTLPEEALEYFRRNDAWVTFFDSIVWKFGAPELAKYEEKLREGVIADKRAAGLDPEQVVASMTQEILKRSGSGDLSERALTSLDLDLLLNDLWLAKGVDEYGPSPSASQAYLAATAGKGPGRACVAVFLDDEGQAVADFNAAREMLRHMPTGSDILTLAELNAADQNQFIRGLGFDVYAAVSTRARTCSTQELVAELVPHVSARAAPLVWVVGEALMAAVARVPENPGILRPVTTEKLGASLALLLADAIVDGWNEKRFNPTLASIFRKIRVVCDVGEQAYFTQTDPPAWAS
jgi:hypothetical protein